MAGRAEATPSFRRPAMTDNQSIPEAGPANAARGPGGAFIAHEE